jgi:prevent-host-death family protein
MNVSEAKAKLSWLINQSIAGKEVVISRAGEPVVRIIPYEKNNVKRKGGQWKGLVKISKNFNDPLPSEIASAFGIKG